MAIIFQIISFYFTLVARGHFLNFKLDFLRAEAFASSIVSNQGVICSEDLLLSDGVTNAWE